MNVHVKVLRMRSQRGELLFFCSLTRFLGRVSIFGRQTRKSSTLTVQTFLYISAKVYSRILPIPLIVILYMSMSMYSNSVACPRWIEFTWKTIYEYTHAISAKFQNILLYECFFLRYI